MQSSGDFQRNTWQVKDLFKIGMSLVLAVIAAFVIILAGFLNEVRIGTMLLRGFLGFVVAGVAGSLFVSFFEGQQKEPDLRDSMQEEEEMSYIPRDDEEESMQEMSGGEESAEESSGFQPLESQDLEHMRSPE